MSNELWELASIAIMVAVILLPMVWMVALAIYETIYDSTSE